tara:strand:+ start:59 stop:340 length:282 start_codon:yes stop_codon:yes gene_type:complete
LTISKVNGREYNIHVGYWIQPYFSYIAKLNIAQNLDDVEKNSDELESVIDKVIVKALSGGNYQQEDKIELFNEIAMIFNSDVKSIKKKLGKNQ